MRPDDRKDNKHRMKKTCSAPLILLIDDEPSIRNLLKETLAYFGDVEEARDGEEGLAKALTLKPDVVLLDVRMPKKDGISVLKELKSAGFSAPIIILTAYGDFDTATTAMTEGAFDYFVKPFGIRDVEEVVIKALSFSKLPAEEKPVKIETFKETFVGKSPRIQEVFKIIGQVSPLSVPVLITGESGSGKELVAKSIHRLSPRSKGPFIPVNCAAIPETLLESELFGYEKGAFTGANQSKGGRFEEAEGGTIFLDEIGDMSLPLQAKLLRVLQDKKVRRLGGRDEIEVDTRFIFATNRDLKKMVREGKFREDLYFRVEVVKIDLPPLREREGDIPLLAEYFLRKYSLEYGREGLTLNPGSLEILQDYPLPGNVRELENIIARSVSLSRGSLVVLDIPSVSTEGEKPSILKEGEPFPSLEQALKDRERELIILALRKTGGNLREAATLLKVPLRTLYRKVKEYQG